PTRRRSAPTLYTGSEAEGGEKKTVWGGDRRGDCRLAPARSRPSPNKAWARKSPVTNLPAHDGMASIVIPCWNQLEFTRFCKFAHKWGLPDVGQRVILRAWAQGGNGPQMTQMDADEETTCGNAQDGGESRSFLPTVVDPMPSASARKVSKDAASPAPTRKRPWAVRREPERGRSNGVGRYIIVRGRSRFRRIVQPRSSQSSPLQACRCGLDDRSG